MTLAERNKLGLIQTATEILALYEGIAGINRLRMPLLTQLNAIEAGATGEIATEIAALYEGIAGVNRFTNALLTKLNAIEANATADQTAAEIRTLLGQATETQLGLSQVATTANTTGGTMTGSS